MTGNDPLDSFEALWELAEMLGQVKPPTATREDIAKSGLEVIRPSDLEQYEKDGRVSSNCVERVSHNSFYGSAVLLIAHLVCVFAVSDLSGGVCS